MTGVLHAAAALDALICTIAGSTININDTAAALDAGVRIESDGDVNSITTVSGDVDIADWITPRAASSLYTWHVRATLNAGSLDVNPGTGTWLALSTSRLWSTGAGNTANLTIEISRDAGSTTFASFTVALDATGA